MFCFGFNADIEMFESLDSLINILFPDKAGSVFKFFALISGVCLFLLKDKGVLTKERFNFFINKELLLVFTYLSILTGSFI